MICAYIIHIVSIERNHYCQDFECKKYGIIKNESYVIRDNPPSLYFI